VRLDHITSSGLTTRGLDADGAIHRERDRRRNRNFSGLEAYEAGPLRSGFINLEQFAWRP
jgi:hypothetical protein